MKQWFKKKLGSYDELFAFANQHHLGPGEFYVVGYTPFQVANRVTVSTEQIRFWYYAEKELI